MTPDIQRTSGSRCDLPNISEVHQYVNAYREKDKLKENGGSEEKRE